MPIRRVKDPSGLVAQARMRSSRRPHYWHVFLWRDKAAFIAGTHGMEDGLASGCHCPCPTLVDPESGELLPAPKVGEVHFIAGKWDMEVVAHELQHAILHRLRVLCPSPQSILVRDEIEAEEEVCYEFGRWFAHIYRWLWDVDPSPRWQRTGGWGLP